MQLGNQKGACSTWLYYFHPTDTTEVNNFRIRDSSKISRKFPHICANIWVLFFSFWLTSLCMTDSRFIHISTNDPTWFLFMGWVIFACVIICAFTWWPFQQEPCLIHLAQCQPQKRASQMLIKVPFLMQCPRFSFTLLAFFLCIE